MWAGGQLASTASPASREQMLCLVPGAVAGRSGRSLQAGVVYLSEGKGGRKRVSFSRKESVLLSRFSVCRFF
jgi:hypothetical protein